MDVPTHRGVVVARNGVVAASQPLAVSAGLGILQRGGTFADAAIATSAVLAVTEPYASQLGGDAFLIVYDSAARDTTAYNASGPALHAATPDRFVDGIPIRGLASASMPGLVDCWFRLHERHGSIPIRDLLAPAIMYARDGFPAGHRYCRAFRDAAASEPPGWFAPMARTLTGADSPPAPGQTVRQPDLAWTLTEIAAGGRDAFYRGAVAERLSAASARQGGLFTMEDLAAYETQVGPPIRTDYRGFTVHGQPPVSQGQILLEALNIVEGYDLASMSWDSPDRTHLLVEAKKLAFADRARYLADPEFVAVPVDVLLSKEFAARRRARIDPIGAASLVTAGEIPHDTTYFCVADRTGSAVSFIQSVFHRFGCGIVAEGTGILFNNRMTGFSLDPASPNMLAPGKRTVHTLNAYVITRGGRDASLAWAGGTPGGDVQVQSNLQVISDLVDLGMDPQQAIETPRWQHDQETGRLEVEGRFPRGTVDELARRGHGVTPIGPWAHGSSYQLISVDPEFGAFHAGSDPRCDGHATGW